MRRTTLLTIAATLVASVTTSPSTSATSYYTGYQDMLTLVNQQRTKGGLKPLCMSTKLMASAYGQSSYQAQVNKMTHDGPVGLMQRFTNQQFQPLSVAENVGESGDLGMQAIMNAWVADPPHLANIMGATYTHFGSAVVKGSGGQYYWTQHFAQAASASEACMDGSSGSTPSSSGAGTPVSSSPNGSGMPSSSNGSGMPSSSNGSGMLSSPNGSGMPSSNGSAPSSMPNGSGTSPSYDTPNSPYGDQSNYPNSLGDSSTPSNQAGNQMSPNSNSNSRPSRSGKPTSGNNSAGGSNLNGPAPPGSNLKINVKTPQSGPQMVCLQGKCYQIVQTPYGMGYLPSNYKPANKNINSSPVFVNHPGSSNNGGDTKNQ